MNLNFSVTEEGLIDQTLNIIVKKEEPNTEKSREEVINKSVDIKKKLKVQEEEILKIVTVHKEGILESDKLLETLKNTKTERQHLKNTKTECQQFSNQVEEQKRFSERIENTRSRFKTTITLIIRNNSNIYYPAWGWSGVHAEIVTKSGYHSNKKPNLFETNLTEVFLSVPLTSQIFGYKLRTI